MTRCEGWRRYGGAFSFGIPKWEQCKKDAVVTLTVKGETTKFPACLECWKEAKDRGNEIEAAEPI